MVQGKRGGGGNRARKRKWQGGGHSGLGKANRTLKEERGECQEKPKGLREGPIPDGNGDKGFKRGGDPGHHVLRMLIRR